MKNEPIGMIGLGLLGSALAERLLATGFAVVGYDLDERRRAELADASGDSAVSAVEVARKCRRIVLSLPTSDVVASVLDEIQNDLNPGAIIADTTTGDPAQAADCAVRLSQLNVEYLDATIAGSSAQARAGEVVVMAGGSEEAFAACTDLFGAFSTRMFHVGPPGTGSTMKLIVNLVLGMNRAVLAEGLSLAVSAGLDAEKTLEVLRAGAAYSRVMDTKGRKMLSGDFEPQARLAQHAKDVELIIALGDRCGSPLPLSKVHRDLLSELMAAGYGEADNSAVIKAFEKRPNGDESRG